MRLKRKARLPHAHDAGAPSRMRRATSAASASPLCNLDGGNLTWGHDDFPKPKLTKTSRDGTGRPKMYLLRYTIRIIPSRQTKLTKQGRDENHFFCTIFISVFGLIPSRKAHLSPLVDALRRR